MKMISDAILEANSTIPFKKTTHHADTIQLLNKYNQKRKMIDLLIVNAKGAGPTIFPHIGRK